MTDPLSREQPSVFGWSTDRASMAAKIAGYIPIVGIVIAIGRAILGAKKAYKGTLAEGEGSSTIVRCALEAFPLVNMVSLPIVDLAIWKSKKPTSKPPPEEKQGAPATTIPVSITPEAAQEEAPPIPKPISQREIFDPLHSFNLLRPSDGPFPKNIRSLIEATRSSGRRRETPETNVHNILQQEAKFLGITLAEYKEILLLSGASLPTDTTQWANQIQREKTLAHRLENLPSQDQITPALLDELCQLLQDHSPLSKPVYFARLFRALRADQNQGGSHSTILEEALKNSIAGVNSRRLHPFCVEAERLIREDFPEITKAEIFDHVREERLPPSSNLSPEDAKKGISPEGEREVLGNWAQEDHDLVQRLWKESGSNQQAFRSHPEFENIKSSELKKLFLNPPKTILFEDLVEHASTTLEQFSATVSNWHGPNPAYYHSTPKLEVLTVPSIAVSSGGLSGAFVTNQGNPGYGDVIFGLSDAIEDLSRAFRHGSNDVEVYLGFNRAIPINPHALATQQFIEQTICRDISSTLPNTLSSLERRFLLMSIERWLENWGTVTYQKGQWQYGMRSTSPQLVNTDLNALLTTMTHTVKRAFSTTIDLTSWDPTPSFSGIQQQSSEVAPQPQEEQPSSPLVCVFTTAKSSIFTTPKTLISKSDITERLAAVGLANIPILSVDMSILWSDYKTRFGVYVPLSSAMVPMNKALRHLREKIPFF